MESETHSLRGGHTGRCYPATKENATNAVSGGRQGDVAAEKERMDQQGIILPSGAGDMGRELVTETRSSPCSYPPYTWREG